MTEFIWSLRASRDLAHQIDYLASRNVTAAARIGDAIEARAAWPIHWPAAGQTLGSAGRRSFKVHGTPFILIYSVDNDAVTILRLRHERQNWQPR